MLKAGMSVEVEASVEEGVFLVPGDLAAVTEDVVTVRLRVREDARVPLSAGTPVSVTALDRTSVVTFESVVLNRMRVGGALEVLLANPESVEEANRSFFRFAYQVPVRLKLPPVEEQPARMVDAETLDLAGGGIACVLGERVDAGSPVEVSISLEDRVRAPVTARGHVVRVVAQPSARKLTYRVGIVFDGIAEADRQRLINFIFAKQREYRQRGLL
jgi:c-di-GMP-binding flagellar brake protein YcgR